ncbi:MAG: hypothetical protein N2B06_02620 [Clostridium sp.]
MKKFSKFLTVLLVVFTLGTYASSSSIFFGNDNTVEAATTRKTVKEGMVTYTVYNVNKYFTKAEVNNIVNNYNKSNHAASKTIQYILGTALNPGVGFALFVRDLSADSVVKPFVKAKSQGKGVRMKYEYWLSNVSNSVYKIKNKTITIQ